MLFDMTIQDIHLDNWNWNVRVYYHANKCYKNIILDDLRTLGINSKDIDKITYQLLYGGVNWGLTYTNIENNYSIVLIGTTTNANQFQNTFDHEKGHLATHIAEVYNIDFYSETYQYLIGDIGLKLFKVAKQYLCDDCRRKNKID